MSAVFRTVEYYDLKERVAEHMLTALNTYRADTERGQREIAESAFEFIDRLLGDDYIKIDRGDNP